MNVCTDAYVMSEIDFENTSQQKSRSPFFIERWQEHIIQQNDWEAYKI